MSILRNGVLKFQCIQNRFISLSKLLQAEINVDNLSNNLNCLDFTMFNMIRFQYNILRLKGQYCHDQQGMESEY